MTEIDVDLEKPRPTRQRFVFCQQIGRHNSAALCGSMALSHFLLCFWSKTTGSTHFPVFFCQLWEKSFNILPASKTLAVEAL